MTFRSEIVTVLALVGVVPMLPPGWLSFSINLGEVEKTVGRAQAATAQEAARYCERYVAQGVESVPLSTSYLPLERLGGSDAGRPGAPAARGHRGGRPGAVLAPHPAGAGARSGHSQREQTCTIPCAAREAGARIDDFAIRWRARRGD